MLHRVLSPPWLRTTAATAVPTHSNAKHHAATASASGQSGPAGRRPTTSTPYASSTVCWTTSTPKTGSALPIMISGTLARVARRRSQVCQVRSVRVAVATSAIDNTENITSRPVTAWVASPSMPLKMSMSTIGMTR